MTNPSNPNAPAMNGAGATYRMAAVAITPATVRIRPMMAIAGGPSSSRLLSQTAAVGRSNRRGGGLDDLAADRAQVQVVAQAGGERVGRSGRRHSGRGRSGGRPAAWTRRRSGWNSANTTSVDAATAIVCSWVNDDSSHCSARMIPTNVAPRSAVTSA